MKKLIFATRNNHKLSEVKEILNGYEVISLKDIGYEYDIDETGETTEENAEIKAIAILEYCKNKNIDCAIIADDSGLFVESLNGEPGIHSARYADDHNEEANRQKLLKNLLGVENRSAYFKCSICYADYRGTTLFEGRTYGNITTEKIGSDAFGYDCLFHSIDLDKTFGQATDEEKNAVSHRGRALEELKKWLDSKN